MKLIRFSRGDSKPRFGVVIGEHAIAFATLQQRSGIDRPELGDSHAYLAGLPETERAARELAAWGEAHLGEWPESERPRLQQVRLHEPIEVAALFDFGLTPRHLKNSAETMRKYEKDNPQTAPILQAFAKAPLSRPAAPPPGVPERLSYYKCNMNSIVGDGRDHSLAALHVAPGHRVRTGCRLRQRAAARGGLLHLQRRLGPRCPGSGIHRRILPDEGHGG